MGVEDGTTNGGGTECLEGLNFLKSDGIGDRVRFGVVKSSDVASWSPGQADGLRTYKRRRHAKSSADSKSEDTGRAFTKEDFQTVQQPQKVPKGVALEVNSREKFHHPTNCPDGCSERSWKIVLEHMFQSLSDDEGGMQKCIQDVLQCRSETGTDAKIQDQPDLNREKCDSPVQNGFQEETSGRPKVLPNRRSNIKSLHTNTGMCRHAWFHILISDKFTSLCKLLSENFQGIKTGSFFDLKLINSRMKDGAYDHSPMLFLTDIQQVWDKIKGIGTAMIALSKDLSDLSKSCYDKQFCALESDSHSEPEQAEANNEFRICTCQRCGEEADGRDYLVCDSCEEMYHVSCIEPPVEEIPLKSWYCSSCTTSGSRSPHENCEVCEKLMVPKASVEVGSPSADNEMLMESVEDTKWATELSLTSNNFGVCKICDRQIEDGEKSRICSHNLCASNSYHARCLTKRELRCYGPCWYCPSCLCRSCLVDKDDDQIVLCDGCDHGYHIYCTQPKLSTIPTGNWYCRSCDAKQKHVKRAREAYEKYEEKQKMKVNEGFRAFGVLAQNWNGKSCMEHDNGGGMEMLLTAVNTLNYEEKCGRF